MKGTLNCHIESQKGEEKDRDRTYIDNDRLVFENFHIVNPHTLH